MPTGRVLFTVWVVWHEQCILWGWLSGSPLWFLRHPSEHHLLVAIRVADGVADACADTITISDSLHYTHPSVTVAIANPLRNDT